MSRSKAKDHILLDVFNLVYSLLLIAFAVHIGRLAGTWAPSGILSTILATLVGFIAFLLIPSTIYFLLPKLEQGRHPFPNSRNSMVWILKFYIKKPLTVPLISNCIFTIHFFAYTVLKLLKCKISPSFQIAANVEIRDPEFVEIAEGVTIGSDTIIAPHRMTRKGLELFDISIEKDCSIGAFCLIGLGSRIGEGSVIGVKTMIGPHVKIGKNCIIADNVRIEEGTIIGDRCIIKSHTFLDKNSRVEKRSVVEALCH